MEHAACLDIESDFVIFCANYAIALRLTYFGVGKLFFDIRLVKEQRTAQRAEKNTRSWGCFAIWVVSWG